MEHQRSRGVGNCCFQFQLLLSEAAKMRACYYAEGAGVERTVGIVTHVPCLDILPRLPRVPLQHGLRMPSILLAHAVLFPHRDPGGILIPHRGWQFVAAFEAALLRMVHPPTGLCLHMLHTKQRAFLSPFVHFVASVCCALLF